MPTSSPSHVTANPVARVYADLRDERRVNHYPPGPTRFSLRRTHRLSHDPLPPLLKWYGEYGPIFTVRVLHAPQVFMLGPAANHYVTVSHAENFHWREGAFKDLVPLLGDALLTTDGEHHDRARRIMMPAFHRERIESMVDAMIEEAQRALAPWRDGMVVDVYDWSRRLAMRIAMRTLLGLNPDKGGKGGEAAEQFERALSFYGRDFALWLLRGPGSPWHTMKTARRRLDAIVLEEIQRRRSQGGRLGRDVLSMLVAAEDEDGSRLSDDEIRDQITTLLFAGHDTSTSTITFLMYELARHPAALARLREEEQRVLGGGPPTLADVSGGLPELDMAIDETLRLYPPAWIGPRKAMRTFEFAGHRVHAGSYVAYCSWASHRLPDLWEDPEAFVPERFTRERKAALPKGAYVPFGGGSRICIGKRLGQTLVKVVATLLLQRVTPVTLPEYEMSIRQMPTLSPRRGLPMAMQQTA